MSGELSAPGGDPAALEGLADQLDVAASGTDGLASGTLRVTGDIKANAGWTGSAADGYTAFTSTLSRGVGGTQAPLSRIAGAVRDYAGYLRTAQEKASAYSSAAQTAQASQHPADAATASAAREDALSAIADQQAAGDSAAVVVREAADALAGFFSPDGPFRDWIEKIHAPWDMLVGDAAVARGMAIVGQGEKLAKDMSKLVKDAPKALREAEAELEGVLDARDAGYATRAEETLRLLDDAEANRSLAVTYGEAAEELTRYAPLWRSVGMSSDALSIIGDGYTLYKPEDSGAAGDVDRGMAAANLGLSGADLLALAGASFEVPVAGQVILIGTGLYLGGDYLYNHWAPFRNVCNDVGHGTVAAADEVARTATSTAKEAWHSVTSIF